jgi:glycosyltransferase involved in cell wall biosynthesis
MQRAQSTPSPDGRTPMLVSVIVPALNASGTLGDQLLALSRQTYSAPWEVLIADNGSSDDTVNIAQSWASGLPGSRVIDASQGRGAGHARNVGAAAANGDLLAFCDADDIVDSGWLSALVEAAAYSDIVGGAVGTAQPLPVHMDYLPWASTSCMAVWKEVFNNLGGFDAEFLRAQDVEFSWRAQLARYRISGAPEAYIWRRPRGRLGAAATQMYQYGWWSARLYKRYRDRGVPTRGFVRLLKRVGWLAIRLPYLAASAHRRRIWIRTAANTAGALAGSLRYRVLYLS